MRRFTAGLGFIFIGAICGLQGQASGAEQHTAFLEQLNEAVTGLVDEVRPGVVAIGVLHEGGSSEDFFRIDPRNPRPDRQRPRQRQRQGQGSGLIVTYKGEIYILTNNHVVLDAAEITVDLADERSFTAEVVGTDSLSDLAVLKIDAKDLVPLPLGDSDKLQVGELVIAIGSPFGFEHSVTNGIVSALGRRRFGSKEYGSFIQTNADINPGNSGGPLINARGEVIGINTAIISSSGGDQGIGFAVPVNLAKNVLEQLVEHGEVRRGLLGVNIGDLDSELAEAFGLETTQGVLIGRVIDDSAADKAGIMRGDIVLEMDGEKVRNTTELKSRIGASLPGTRVKLLILRDKKEKTVEVKLGQLSADVMTSRSTPRNFDSRLGFSVQDLTQEIAEKLGFKDEEGVVVTRVRRGSEAARKGLRPRDLIQEVNQQPIDSVEQYKKALKDVALGEAVLLVVRSAGEGGSSVNFMALRVPQEE
jgi:serine protease Do